MGKVKGRNRAGLFEEKKKLSKSGSPRTTEGTSGVKNK